MSEVHSNFRDVSPMEQLDNFSCTHVDLQRADLCETIIRRKEAVFSDMGALVVKTGLHTGRSANDKYIVKNSTTESTVWWEGNKPMSQENFDLLLSDMLVAARKEETFQQHLFAGASEDYRLPVSVITSKAWHSLFIRNLLLVPKGVDRFMFVGNKALNILCLPDFAADPQRHHTLGSTVIALDFTNNVVLIAGTAYAGEIKKSVFTTLNYHLPDRGIMPMHCSVNYSYDKSNSAIFFGLSGTGKTTLSSAGDRILLGDDEHGWSPHGLFNFEGGCYAKTINLSHADEPDIFSAVNRFGSTLENVTFHPNTDRVNFADDSITENTRSGYPLSFVAGASPTGETIHPRYIVMLTADAFGILPPLSFLSMEQAVYHFLSGYTARVAGTEQGVDEPKATFSACFGAPFMPRHPTAYGDLLQKLLSKHQSKCWLLNTGWTNGGYGKGKRFPLSITRKLLAAVLSGELENGEFEMHDIFHLRVPKEVEGVPQHYLDVRSSWDSPEEYDIKAIQLSAMFRQNFEQFLPFVSNEISKYSPSSDKQ